MRSREHGAIGNIFCSSADLAFHLLIKNFIAHIQRKKIEGRIKLMVKGSCVETASVGSGQHRFGCSLLPNAGDKGHPKPHWAHI